MQVAGPDDPLGPFQTYCCLIQPLLVEPGAQIIAPIESEHLTASFGAHG